MDKLLIVGCGDIGRRVIRHVGSGVRIIGMVRRRESAERLKAMGVEPLVFDLDRATGTLPSGVVEGAVLLHLAPPPPRGTTDPRTARLIAALGTRRPQRVVYLGTSGVYGDCGGAWVDERRPPRPQTDRARRRYDAERQWLRWMAETGRPVVRLRVGGIYAPDRLPEARLRAGRVRVLCPRHAPWSNRIHAEDLARVCLAAAERGRPGAVYNVSDGHPTTMTDYFYRVADHLGLPRPPCVDPEAAEARLTPEMLSFIRESRRLDNRLMREELGVEPEFPDLEAGLRVARQD